jgi:tetratricopeptide (TPR) repeat protein
MHRDQHGIEMTAASAEAVRHFDATILHYLGIRSDTGDKLKATFQADPDMPMAHIARGCFMKLFCSAALDRKAEESLAEAERLTASGGTDREKRHVAALRAWCGQDIAGATDIWNDILLEHPRDVFALRLGHFTHFYMGDSAGMRDSVQRVLPYWSEEHPAYGYVVGMSAFGFEETAHYAAAERDGRRAVELNPRDIWATHAVAHVMEMQGRSRDGVEWLARLSPNWSDCNNFRFHTWWHKCLFHMESGQFDAVLKLYDTEIRADTSSDDYLDMSNAIALLWRLDELGIDTGDRWAELADKSETKIDDHFFAFHDSHYMIALGKGGRFDKARSMLRSMEGAAERTDTTEAPVFAEVGLPLCRAILAIAEGDHAKGVELMAPVRRGIYRIGGSHAQRDLFVRMLVSSALTAGEHRFARAVLAERSALNPESAWAWSRTADALEGLGDTAGAADAKDRAAAALAA